MEQKTDRLYPSARPQQGDLEKILEKKFKDINSLINHINNLKGMVKYFKDKNHKSKNIKIIKH